MSSEITARGGFETGFGSKGYRAYVLGTLLLAYIFNFIDRVMIGYLAAPIKAEFSLTNTQFGLLSGLAFAAFYTFLGIPIARLSERVNRVWLIAGSIILWSAMTALCGVATSFFWLLIFRLGVGVGEAGLTPAANSLIADYFVPRSRPVAISIYSTGITIGSLCAAIYVGLYITQFGWREVFITVGLAGIPVGLLMLLSVREPPRGFTDPPGAVRPKAPPFFQTAARLLANSTFRQVTIGATLASFVGYALSSFIVLFLQGTHGLGVQQAALTVLAPLALTGAIGTWLCGFLVSRIGGFSILWLPALGLVLATVFHVLAFQATTISWLLSLLIAGNLFQYFYLGPMYAVAGAVVEGRSRATAIAVLLFVVNLIGLGLGPLFAGVLSDVLAGGLLAQVGDLTLVQCAATDVVLSEADKAVCAKATADGLRYALAITACIFFWGAMHFLLAMRTWSRDRVVA